MTGKTLVQVENLHRCYGDTWAVREVSFVLNQGQVLGFLGPNGAGKSTTMQLLAGNLGPDVGRILINGIDLLDEPRRAKASIGYLPEFPPLYRELTVDEYLNYCARLHRMPRATITIAVERAKERCGLPAVGRRLIGNLSKGYQQRVGLAQAILHEPAVIVLDEPTVGLDPIQIREIRDLIRELGREHGVIISTHILSEIQAICSHVQVMHQGRLVYASSVAELGRRQHGTSLIVALNAPPAPEILAGLPAISGVEALGDGRFRLRHALGAEPAAALAVCACEQGWGLTELTPERTTLEQVFIDLTLGYAEST